jgi:hypothetical protein
VYLPILEKTNGKMVAEYLLQKLKYIITYINGIDSYTNVTYTTVKLIGVVRIPT